MHSLQLRSLRAEDCQFDKTMPSNRLSYHRVEAQLRFSGEKRLCLISCYVRNEPSGPSEPLLAIPYPKHVLLLLQGEWEGGSLYSALYDPHTYRFNGAYPKHQSDMPGPTLSPKPLRVQSQKLTGDMGRGYEAHVMEKKMETTSGYIKSRYWKRNMETTSVLGIYKVYKVYWEKKIETTSLFGVYKVYIMERNWKQLHYLVYMSLYNGKENGHQFITRGINSV